MPARQRSEVPASVSRLGQRFAVWRKSRQRGERIPESLWRAAVKVASEHGLNSTAQTLKLDYYSLKRRLEESAASSPARPMFVELPSAPVPIVNECVIELEDAAGSRLRVQLKGQNAPDLLALSRSFWNVD
jgi:hypothetical protein